MSDWETPASGVGGTVKLDPEQLASLSAAEAIALLSPAAGAGKLDLDTPDFPGPVAEAAYWDDAALVGIRGPVGSGKTTTLLKSRIRRAMSVPRSVIDGMRRYKLLVIRETYRQLWSTTIPDFLKVYPRHLGDWSGGKGGPVTFVMQFADGTHVPAPPGHQGPWSDEIEFIVEFMAFGDDIEGSMRGYQTTDIWLHEMDTNPIEVILNGITRINRWPGMEHFKGYPPELLDFGQIVGDFNAPEPDNWLAVLILDPEKMAEIVKTMNADLPPGANEIRFSFHVQPGYGEPGAENLQNLSPGYYAKQIAVLRALGRGDKVERLVFNRIVHARVGEPVFLREFSRRIHVSPHRLDPVPGRGLLIGLDQGFKGAAVVGQETDDGILLLLGELHFPKERLMARVFGDRLGKMLAQRWPGFRVEAAYGDMAGEHGASQAADENQTWNLLVGQAAGFRVRPQKIGTNRLQPRLEAIRALLEAPLVAGRPGLLIDPSCTFTIAGFEGRYVWTDEITRNGDKRKVPDKSLTEANVMDALQYLALRRVRGNGLSTGSMAGADPLPGSPQFPDSHEAGLKTGFDILNPYGGL